MNQGIDPNAASGPPPLPPRATPVAPPPRRGMHGCLIALIVCAALAVPMAGILAAIAIPAYHDYTIRARIAAASTAAQPLRALIEHGTADNAGACPANGDNGIGAADSYADQQIARIAVGAFENGHCGYEIELRGFGNAAIDGGKLWWERNGDDDACPWHCSSSIDNKYLPAACRTR